MTGVTSVTCGVRNRSASSAEYDWFAVGLGVILMSDPFAYRASAAFAASYDAVNAVRLTARPTINDTTMAPVLIAHGRRPILRRTRPDVTWPNVGFETGRRRVSAPLVNLATSRLPASHTASGKSSRVRFSCTDRPKYTDPACPLNALQAHREHGAEDQDRGRDEVESPSSPQWGSLLQARSVFVDLPIDRPPAGEVEGQPGREKPAERADDCRREHARSAGPGQ